MWYLIGGILLFAFIAWMVYEFLTAPKEEELWPDLKQEFKGKVWTRKDYLANKAI